MRVLAFGNSGSGKSTFARRVGAQHGLAVLDLDNVVWSPGAPGLFRPDAETIEALAAFVRAHRAWVVEGCYARWMEHLLPRATELVFINPGEDVCLRHCLDRPWEPNKYATREEQDVWLPLLCGWVRAYYSRDDDMSLTAHRRLFEGFPGIKREMTTDDDTSQPGIPAASDPPRALEAERLWLLPSHRPHWRELRQGAAAFTKKFTLPVADGLVDFVQPEDRDARVAAEWDSFLIVHRADQALVGFGASRKLLDTAGGVEIAYGIAPSRRGHGLATEAARALTERALRRPGVQAVCANTLPELNASARVLAKCGFVRAGESIDPDEGAVWRWEKHP